MCSLFLSSCICVLRIVLQMLLCFVLKHCTNDVKTLVHRYVLLKGKLTTFNTSFLSFSSLSAV